MRLSRFYLEYNATTVEMKLNVPQRKAKKTISNACCLLIITRMRKCVNAYFDDRVSRVCDMWMLNSSGFFRCMYWTKHYDKNYFWGCFENWFRRTSELIMTLTCFLLSFEGHHKFLGDKKLKRYERSWNLDKNSFKRVNWFLFI